MARVARRIAGNGHQETVARVLVVNYFAGSRCCMETLIEIVDPPSCEVSI